MYRIPLSDTVIGEEEIEAATRVLRSGWLTMGREVEAFEEEFARKLHCKHAVAVANASVALELSLWASGIGPGDEVILPSITFIACLNAVRRAGATPVLADVTSELDLTISPEDIQRKVSAKTRAVMTMPHSGYCPDMEAIVKICEENDLVLIEDSCHAPLAHIDGKYIGTFGKCGCWSFFGNKNMTTGEGGMITTDDDELAEQLRLLRNHGLTKPTWSRAQGSAGMYDVARPGTNARMDEIRAAIGRVQLSKLEGLNQKRKVVAENLRVGLKDLKGLVVPFDAPRGTPVHHIFVVLLPEGINRDDFRQDLAEQGIQTSIHYIPLDRFAETRSLFEGCGRSSDLPVTRAIENRIVTLPLGPTMSKDQCHEVVEMVSSFLS